MKYYWKHTSPSPPWTQWKRSCLSRHRWLTPDCGARDKSLYSLMPLLLSLTQCALAGSVRAFFDHSTTAWKWSVLARTPEVTTSLEETARSQHIYTWLSLYQYEIYIIYIRVSSVPIHFIHIIHHSVSERNYLHKSNRTKLGSITCYIIFTTSSNDHVFTTLIIVHAAED